ncbi:MAG: DNA-binding protein, partial [Mucilaginibacter sp.]|nr:DNA-binding protein [Mucilaginibacter sp.]
HNVNSPDENHALMDVHETSKFLNLSVSTIYTKVCRGEIPALKPGRRLYFDKTELINWIKSSRKLSNEEIAARADQQISRGRVAFHRKRKAYRKI